MVLQFKDFEFRFAIYVCGLGFPVHLCVGGFGFLVVVVEAWAMVEVVAFVWIFCGKLWL